MRRHALIMTLYHRSALRAKNYTYMDPLHTLPFNLRAGSHCSTSARGAASAESCGETARRESDFLVSLHQTLSC